MSIKMWGKDWRLMPACNGCAKPCVCEKHEPLARALWRAKYLSFNFIQEMNRLK